MHYSWNWNIFWQSSPTGAGTYFDLLLSGFKWTLLTAALSWALAVVVGSVVGLIRTLRSRIVTRLAAAYIELFRNVPLLVQLFLWYFVLPELLPSAWGAWLKQLPDASFVTATVGVGLYTSARVAEQVRAGLNSLPIGLQMASVALGLTTLQAYRYVLLPIAFRVILPPLTSECLACIKNTSVALTIGLVELTASARAIEEYSFQVFEAFTAATILYLLLNTAVVAGMAWVERRVVIPGFTAER